MGQDQIAEAVHKVQLALQRSEGGRAWVLAGLIGLLVALDALRYEPDAVLANGPVLLTRVGLSGLLIGLLVGLALWVRRAGAAGRLLPASVWVVSTLIESTYATALLLTAVLLSRLDPVDSVRIPAGFVYLILAVLSVLRMRPVLSLIGGLSCAVQYAGLILLAERMSSTESAALSATAVGYPMLVLVGWLCAAFVAREMRRHFIAGLREADTRAELAAITGELELAQRIQQRLMPTEPLNLPGYEVAGWNRPASRTGGDYYDWIRIDQQRAAVVIGDVTGHGVGPALLMAVCRAYARATLPGSGGLHGAMTRLNALITADMDDGRFITFAAALLETDTGRVDLLSAGHGPIVLHSRAGARTSTLGTQGVPLGILDDADFDQPGSIMLEPGDVLLLVTDGFNETQNRAGEQFGVERVEQFLAEHQGLPADELIASLAAAVEKHAGGMAQADDMTAVVIRRVAR
jgi:serine phosphatase RsbU (regulator of sigma subunit)